MAIGPEATHMASGRIVVVAGFYGLLGSGGVVLGLGPLLRPADATTRAIGFGVVAAGLVLLIGAVGLVLRRGWARRAGVIAGWSAIGLGLLIAALGLTALEGCAGSEAGGCTILVGGLSIIGLVIAGSGIASVTIVRRARLSVFRARGRR